MEAVRSWSFTQVLLASGTWVLLSVLSAAGWLYFQLRADSSGSAGIGAASVGVSEVMLAVMLAILVVPPAVLIFGWLIMHRS
jgi:hypothetical protein